MLALVVGQVADQAAELLLPAEGELAAKAMMAAEVLEVPIEVVVVVGAQAPLGAMVY
jgi:hypothetical protein